MLVKFLSNYSQIVILSYFRFENKFYLTNKLTEYIEQNYKSEAKLQEN